MKKNIIIAFVFVLLAGIFVSCDAPSPLFGTWSDNIGNQMVLINDGTFSATVNGVDYDGSFTTITNAITFKSSNGMTIVSEWDLRGSMLYLTWRSINSEVSLTLFRTN